MGHVVYEEGGELKVGTVLTETESSLQVEAPHGKRSKIKSTSVLLRFTTPEPRTLLSQAQGMQEEIDIDLLWSVCPAESEWHFSALAQEYQGHVPNSVEQLAVLLRLQSHPIYFHRRGRGLFRAAAPDTLKAALAGLERRRQQEALKAEAVLAMAAGECPDWVKQELPALLYRPDKNTLAWKTLDAAATEMKQSPAQVLAHCGVIQGSRGWHEGRFEFDYFGELGPTLEYPLEDPGEWPLYPVPVFSIDDATTTEIDDAFSVLELDSEYFEVGIHIAAPALLIDPRGELGGVARERMSTVYMPGRKIPMLPERVIARCSLDEGEVRPTLSLLLTVQRSDSAVVARRTVIHRVTIATNVRLHQVEALDDLSSLPADQPHGRDLAILSRVAEGLAQARGARDRPAPQYFDYAFAIDGERVQITLRPRGAPLDELVSELMIEVNRHWASELAGAGWFGLFRVQGQGRTGMAVEPAPHQGLGLAQYAWCSSPLRRYPDLLNQWQLIRRLQQQSPVFDSREECRDLALAFERAYEAYQDFQRQMERYWSLRWLEQEGVSTCEATLLREGTARLTGLPLVVKVPLAQTLEAGTRVRLTVRSIDLWGLELHCELNEVISSVETAAS
ncbi:MAG: RNB domain-containing ribonuclease [Ferrovum sp.]|nr:RNB domain-containing ribonuclease [Ferrovum sp.]NDU87399.1 RNB domain-containing ribonuclease [Ferrovum sp.]